MAQDGPKTPDEIIQKFVTCRQKIENQLEKLAELRPGMINELRAKAADIETNTPDSKKVIAAKVVAVAAAGAVSLPVTAATAGACVASSFYEYVRRQGAKENAKNTLQLHEKETKILLDKLKEWKSLVEDLKTIYPGVDSQVMAAALLFFSKEKEMSTNIIENIKNLMSCVALKAGDFWTGLKKIWEFEEGFVIARGVLESLLQTAQSLFSLLEGWFTETNEVNSESLRTLAQKMEEAAAKEKELHQMLKDLPAPDEVYTERGMTYVIRKSRKLEWFLYWDAASEQFIKVLKLDNCNIFSLKTVGGQTTLGPADVTVEVVPLQSLTISTEEEKTRALELVKAIMGVNKISPSTSDLINLLKVVKSNNTQFKLDGLSKVIKEFQERCGQNGSFSKEMILAEILD